MTGNGANEHWYGRGGVAVLLVSKVVEIVALLMIVAFSIYAWRQFAIYHKERKKASLWQGILFLVIVITILIHYFLGLYRYPLLVGQ